MEQKTPWIEESLLQYLEQAYPDRCPEPDETERKIWMNVGAVGVVKHLRRLFEDQFDKQFGDNEDVYRRR
jgi:hypothetical protein